jgi:hypothetical protein
LRRTKIYSVLGPENLDQVFHVVVGPNYWTTTRRCSPTDILWTFQNHLNESLIYVVREFLTRSRNSGIYVFASYRNSVEFQKIWKSVILRLQRKSELVQNLDLFWVVIARTCIDCMFEKFWIRQFASYKNIFRSWSRKSGPGVPRCCGPELLDDDSAS